MEPETAQVLMEIQSTFQTELADKSDLNCDSDESGKTKKYVVPFQKLLSCLKCGKAFTTTRQKGLQNNRLPIFLF